MHFLNVTAQYYCTEFLQTYLNSGVENPEGILDMGDCDGNLRRGTNAEGIKDPVGVVCPMLDEESIVSSNLAGVSPSASLAEDGAGRFRDPPLNNALTSSHAYSISFDIL